MTTNGVSNVLKILVTVTGLVGLIYFGVRLGNLETSIATNQRDLSEHNARVEAEHHFIEQRTDRKLADQRELIIAELRALNARLDRIDRKIP